MQRYQNKSGDSGVAYYEIGEDYITIQFEGNSSAYTYNEELNGKKHIDKMKTLAQAGKGLGTYINRHSEVSEHFVKR